MIRIEGVSVSAAEAADAGASRRSGMFRGSDLEIRDGEWVAIAGANGSGKTTLCRAIAGLLRPAAGRVLIDGIDSCSLRDEAGGRQAVGIAFQNPDSQFVTSSARREILFGLENIGLDRPEMQLRLAGAAKAFDLEHLLDRNPHTLSGGEKQRLALASIWAAEPRHLVLDEPFSFLDDAGKRSFLEALRRSFGRQRRTVLWATFEAGEIALADRVIYLESGGVAYDGPPATFLASPPDCIVTDEMAEVGRSSECAPARILVDIRDAEFRPGHGAFSLGISELSIAEGESVGITGPSGSGKTTLLLGCAGLLPPARGCVMLFGKRIRSQRGFPAGRVAFLFQSPEEGFFAPTVREEVALGARNLRGASGLERVVAEALEAAGLDPAAFLERSPHHLSQGEKRLVAVASMMVLGAPLFLMDEPTIFLDGRSRRSLFRSLESLDSSGAALVTASHDSRFLGAFARRSVQLANGALAASRSAPAI